MNSQPPPVTRSLLSDSNLHDWWQYQWYQTPVPNAGLLLLETVFRQAVGLRRQAYRNGLRKRHRLPVPVVVVGNLTVGGVGKTPLVIWLAGELSRRGLKPGIVSRGYGGNRTHQPLAVGPDSNPADCGDEPVLIARRTGCQTTGGCGQIPAGHHRLQCADCRRRPAALCPGT
jgi:tetraacyldisaccharide 4'-kinase